MGMGPVEFLFVFVIFVAVGLALPVWAVVDALGAPDTRWDTIGQSRLVWVAVIVVGTVGGGLFGVALAVVCLASVRPKLRAVTAGR